MNSPNLTTNSLPGIDMILVNDLMEVLEDSFVELIDIFLEDTPLQIAGMAAAINQGDLQKTRSYAHILNGSCSNFGAHKIDRLAGEIRELCKNAGDDRANLTRLLGEIQQEYTVVAQSLITLRDHLTSKA